MKKLPEKIQNSINPNLIVTYWSRRAVFEVIEEISQSIFNAWAVIGVGLALEDFFLSFDNFQPWVYWLAVGIFTLLASKKGIYEWFLWRNEIYIVARDPRNGNGKVYKFWGWPNLIHVSGSITAGTPTVFVNTGEPKARLMFYATWRWLTKENMAKVTLHSLDVNFPLLNAQRVNPFLEKAIDQVRGAPPVRSEPSQNITLEQISHITQALTTGLLDKNEAKRATRHLIFKRVYGNE
jgi:hypothetical protein